MHDAAYLLRLSTLEDRYDVMVFARCFRDKLRADKRYGTSKPVCSSLAARVKRSSAISRPSNTAVYGRARVYLGSLV